ncbi:MAG TPA: AI-2E family transporter [Kofleriaceae bacterium]|jgi:predicted PurR-regulated permease PerM|nr:AI-2E family transporter [Kofleriaceae bacterium]
MPDLPGEPSGGVPHPSDPLLGGTVTGSITQPISGSIARGLPQTWLGEGGVLRRFVTRWGFPLFVVLVLFLGREVLLPFVFAGLIAYILAPVVRWMADRTDGTHRIPRGLAIVMCYLVFISLVVGFLFLLVPRLSRDVARIGKEAPGLYKRINEEWTPAAARWLEGRFPSLVGVKAAPEEPAAAPEVPPGTAFTATPLAGGRYALQLMPGGIDLKLLPDGSYRIQANEARTEPASLEDKLRTFVKKALVGLQSKLNDLVRLGQSLVAGFIRGIFLFFFTLMIGAFILIDLEKVHAFLRSLFPANVRDDYDVIIAGIDRGLSGVIRGQLLICVINGVLTYIGLLVFGVKYGLILAVVAGLMSLIPIFGSILSSVPIVLVALVSGDEGIDVFRGVAMTLWIIGIHFIEANLLNPKIIGTAAKIHPVLVIFSLFLGEHAYGLVGALLAVPVLSAISVVFMFFYRKTWKDAPRSLGRGGGTGPLARPPDTAPDATLAAPRS